MGLESLHGNAPPGLITTLEPGIHFLMCSLDSHILSPWPDISFLDQHPMHAVSHPMQRNLESPLNRVPLSARIRLLCALVVAVIAFLHLDEQASAQGLQELEVEVQAGKLTGLPIHWSKVDAVLLDSSGRMHQFEQRHLINHRLLDKSFAPLSLLAAREQLLLELGNGFDTLIAGPYVIAAPAGQAERWRDRFSALLAGYTRYFQVRGWKLRAPDFPLCVIVFPSRQDFVRYAKREGQAVPDLAVGSYFPKSNRCVLYHLPNDYATAAGSSRTAQVDWEQTESTITHEAVHQLAYNTGVHERLFQNPLWFVEGLATMFEQPAVYDSRLARGHNEPMPAEMLERLKPLLSNAPELAKRIETHIVSDQLFSTTTVEAYALACGMTTTLTKHLPKAYGQFIAFQQARRFGSYEAGERMSDFRAAFEISPIELAQLMQRQFEH